MTSHHLFHHVCAWEKSYCGQRRQARQCWQARSLTQEKSIGDIANSKQTESHGVGILTKSDGNLSDEGSGAASCFPMAPPA